MKVLTLLITTFISRQKLLLFCYTKQKATMMNALR